jgi:mono/diheme cytochrome c family protein
MVFNRRGAAPVTAGVAMLSFGIMASGRCQAAATPDLVEHGKYLAILGDCQACHTAPSGKPFAGGLEMDTPFGKISTPNITPDKETGIGNYTDAQFLRVLHAGIRRDGEYLYPVMPFPWYTKVTDDDGLAIKAYLFSLAPIHAPRPPLQISFPFNVRSGLAVWDKLFLKEGVFKPDPSKSPEINRGAYIVQGLAHCGECHDGRNLLGAGAVAKPLQGGPIDHWYAPNITSDVHTGIGRYTDDQLFMFLKTGTAPGVGTVIGPMAQTQHESLSKLTDSDLHAVVAYLKSTKPEAGFTQRHLAGFAHGDMPGAESYLNHCASCHQLDGKGVGHTIPTLVGNGAVMSGGPQTVIEAVLGGIEAQGTYGPMPAVGTGMSDQEVADAANYVRAAWGNNAPAAVGPGEVASLRKQVHTYLSGTLPGFCPTLADPSLKQFVDRPDVQALLAHTDEGNILQNVNSILALAKTGDNNAKQRDLVNSLSIGYCQTLQKDQALSEPQRLAMLNQFGERVYTQVDHGGAQ